MHLKLKTAIKDRSLWPILILLGVVAAYSNTFYASWHLDDIPNIVNNTHLHLDSLEPQKLINTFFTDHHNPEQLRDTPYRPVACLSFALNWYVSQDNVFGYHIVNLALHGLTALGLYLFVKLLLLSPRLRSEQLGNPYLIAFITSILWATNPIQTQAVTYIVQRMALLAAFFYLLAMVAYLKARIEHRRIKTILWLIACAGFYALGVNSKPNAAMLPLAIVLLEVIFFQDLADKRIRKTLFYIGLILSIVILAIGSMLFLNGKPLSFLNLYDSRTFGLTERLLTQPRILLFYLSQIFLPLPGRLSISHDVILSSSLAHPWTTVPSILGVMLLIGFGIWHLRKKPLMSLAILFYFLNHIIESSAIGLELVFEHRNYLPSFFLFLPIAWGVDHLLSKYQKKSWAVYAAIVSATLSVVLLFSISTYIRNQVWKDEITLWMDAASKAPNDARASNNLAIQLAWGDRSQHPKRYDMALKLFEDSLNKNLTRKDLKAGIYGNMALIYFYQKGNSQKAFQCFEKALDIDPDNLKIRREWAETLTIHRNFDAALRQADILLLKNSNNGRYQNLKGLILLWQERYVDALACFKMAYELLGPRENVLLNSGVALSLAGFHAKAEGLLNEAIERFPADMTLRFAIIENSMRQQETDRARAHARNMLKLFTKREIEQGIETYVNNPNYAPLSATSIRIALDWPNQ